MISKEFKCFECGELVEMREYSMDVSVDYFCLEVACKTENTKYMGTCFRCGTNYEITKERKSIISGPKRRACDG